MCSDFTSQCVTLQFLSVLERQFGELQKEEDAVSATNAPKWKEQLTQYSKRLQAVSEFVNQSKGLRHSELRALLFELPDKSQLQGPQPDRNHVESQRLKQQEAEVGADFEGSIDNQEEPPLAPDETQKSGIRYRGYLADLDYTVTSGNLTHFLFVFRKNKPNKQDFRSALVKQDDEEEEEEEELFSKRDRTEGPNNVDAKRTLDDLTEDLLEMAGQLKQNTQSVETMLKADATKLDDLDAYTENNLRKMKGENQSLKDQLKTSTSHTLWLWIILIFVGIVFIWMIVFIRIFPKQYW